MRVVRWCFGSRLSQIYLAVVAVATLFSVWELRAWVEREAEVAGTFPVFATAPPLFLTAPTSLLLEWWLIPADWAGLWSFTVPVLVGALVNAAALNGIRARRQKDRPAP